MSAKRPSKNASVWPSPIHPPDPGPEPPNPSRAIGWKAGPPYASGTNGGSIFDHYAKPQAYGAIRTKDWKTFHDVSGQVHFPEGHRHGTVVKITAQEAR